MIVDRMERLNRYAGLSEGFAKAAKFLSETDWASLPLGRTDIDGDRVFVNVQENRLTSGEPGWEAHDRYADIQVVACGHERFGFGQRGQRLPLKPGSDLRPCAEVEGFFFDLTDGEFALYLPGEIHASCMAVDQEGAVSRKLVVKVLVP